MDEKPVPLVALYRCKECGIRLFEKDAIGHLERHGVSGRNIDWRKYFARGSVDVPKAPGAHHKAFYNRPRGRKRKPWVKND